MKKALASLILLVAGHAHATGLEVLAGVLLGVAIASPTVVVTGPPVIVYPQQIYSPHPVYHQPQLYPVPRVIASSEPCYQYGQMVMTFDQFGRPIGYRNCQ